MINQIKQILNLSKEVRNLAVSVGEKAEATTRSVRSNGVILDKLKTRHLISDKVSH